MILFSMTNLTLFHYFFTNFAPNIILLISMRRTFLTFLLCVSAVIAACAGDGVINLSGQWQFRLDGDAEYNDVITLPGSMPERMKGHDISVRTQWVGALYDSSYYFNPYMAKYREEGKMKLPFFLTPAKHYVGKAWYRKQFFVQYPNSGIISKHDKIQGAKSQVQDYELFIERPHIATTVWVNGRKVNGNDRLPSSPDDGRQNSLSVPHVYNLSGYLVEGENTIEICVDNDPEVAKVGNDSHSVTDQTQGDWNGMVGRIEVRPVPVIKNIRIYPDIDRKEARVLVLASGKSGKDMPLELIAESFNTAKRHIVSTKAVIPKGGDSLWVTLDMGNDMLLWDEHCPQMYRLSVQGCGNALCESYFGMRKIETRNRMFYVNGKETQLRGTVENCTFPNTGYPPTDLDSWVKVFETYKQWGLNHVRFHTYCPPEAAFLAADLVGIYMQPEGPSWPNHGVKLGRGEYIDTYLYDEAVRIMDEYGNHPSFTFFAFGNEPAGNWVRWSTDAVARIKEYDPRHINCGFSVGGGWAWQPGSEFAVKAGARGLNEWAKSAPESMADFNKNITVYNGKDMPGTPITMPFVTHEMGQWCAFPDFSEITKYTGVNKARNFEIFRDLLRDNGMEAMGKKFLLASGKLQTLCYKYETERILRTPRYAGFQILSLNDYSGQGTALVGVTNVFYDEKGYVSAPEFREFCSKAVPLATFPKFTYTDGESFEADLTLNNYTGEEYKDAVVTWRISGLNAEHSSTTDIAMGQAVPLGHVSVPLNSVTKAGKYTLEVDVPAAGAHNHWDFWVYPNSDKNTSLITLHSSFNGIYVTDSLDKKAVKVLRKGGKVLICAAGKVTYGREVKQQFTPVFWNTSWFKMRPPHTTGIYVDNEHPVFADFPTDYHSDLQWWELVNKAQVMQFTDFPRDFQPTVQSIDTWFVSRKIGMLFEAKVGKGRLLMTSMDITNNLDRRIVARQLQRSILSYMCSEKFQPRWQIDVERISDLFTKVAGEVNMFTNESPDELKPALK